MPKKVNHKARRQSLAEAAVEAIDQAGLDAVRLVDVAKAAKATTGSVVHYLPTKDAVLAAALDAVVDRLLRDVEQAGSADLLDMAYLCLPIDEEGRQTWRVWLQYWGRAVSNPALRQRHEFYYAEIRDRLSRLLLQLDPGCDAADIADAIISAVDGLGLRATLEPERWPPERLRHQISLALRPLLAGLKSRGTPSTETENA